MEKEFPSYVIGHSQECLSLFLDVLKTSNDVIASEVIGLIESLQLCPKTKASLQEKLALLKQIPPDSLQQKDGELTNFKEWSLILTWERDAALNQTMYTLMCLKDLIQSKIVVSTRNLSKAQE